jgi:hypothetical protein
MNKPLTLLIATGVFLAASVAGSADPEPAKPYVTVRSVLAMPDDASKEQQALVNDLAKTIDCYIVLKSKHNPICCVWLEINGYYPSPGDPGYIIVNQSGGILITASDIEQLRKAVARFKASLRKTDHGFEVPEGLITNFPIAAQP